jgi:uncharacterized protein (TIGR02266 family)
LKGKTILLAHSSDVFRTMFSNTLTKSGFKIILARDGKETIQHLSSNGNNIDLLLLDLEIPQFKGFKVLEWVKNNHLDGTLPVLVIAESYEFGNVMTDLKPLGAAELTTRSITCDHLIYKVNNLLCSNESSNTIAKRVPTTIPVEFRSGDTSAAGFILNLSETGLFINYSNKILKTGDTLYLTFPLPSNDDVIKAEGKVVWLNKFEGSGDAFFKGFGIHFTKIKPDDREKIANFLKRELDMSG